MCRLVTARRLHGAATRHHCRGGQRCTRRRQRVVVDPDYNSTTGRSVRIIGFSIIADDIVTVIVLEHEGSEYGVNGWVANEKDRRLYNQGGQHEQEG